MDLDDWEISAEDLDFLERDAIRKVNERKASSAAASSSCSCSSPPAPSAAAPFPSRSLLSSPRPPNPSRRDLPPSLWPPVQSPPARGNLERRYEQPSPSKSLGLSPANTDWVNPRDQGEALSPSASCTLDRSRETGNDPLGNPPKLSVRLYLHASGDIAAKFPYHQLLVEAFRKIPRASWHAKERLWMFPASSLIASEEVLNGITCVNVEKLDPLVNRALAAASAAPDLQGLYDRMPSFIESKLLPFQRDGVRFLLQHGGRALLADEMGLGKTLQAIAFTACIRESWPVLILTPSSLRLHWASMIQHWLNIPSSDILVVLSQYGGSNRGGFNVVYSSIKTSIHLDGVFNIISYDVAQKLHDALLESEFKIVIADESHFLKNAQAKRTNASVPILQKAQCAILLSGTPALSRPIELFKQLQALYPEVYKNVHEYGNRYCRGGFFGLYQGASNHEELHNLMKATVMVRRLKKDVLSELPVKRRQQVFLELDEKDLKQIRALFHELEVIKSNIQACDSVEMVASLKISQRNIINKIYNDSAEAKIPAVIDYLGTVIEAGCKFLIFAHHQPMIDSIHKFLLKKKVNCVRIDGRTPSSTRQELVSHFQENDDIKAAVLSIKAAGVGLTLTAASTVIFAELSWTPGDIIQAEDRAHRIGQVHSVNIYYLLANETVDDIIWDVVQGKLENLGQMLDGQENTLDVSTCAPSGSPIKQGTLDSFLKCSSPAKQSTTDSFSKCSSPAKQRTTDSFCKSSSPAKQRTMDSFLKRCHSTTEGESQPKIPRK